MSISTHPWRPRRYTCGCSLNKVCIIAEQLCHFLECGCHDVAVALVIVKAEVCVPLGMNAVAGDLRAERVIRKCVCGPVVGRAQIPADRIEDGLCFLFGFGERGGIGGLLFLDAVDVAGGDGDILGIEVTLCAIGKFYFIPSVGASVTVTAVLLPTTRITP